MSASNIVSLIVSIVIAQAAGGLGALFNVNSIPTWYRTINKSKLNPPNWVFGPVWTTLFLLMAIAAWLVWQVRAQDGASVALWTYGLQLVLNVMWSAIFFGLKRPGWAFVEIIILWLAILATIYSFSAVSGLAAWLLVPYILWVSFAAYLNFSVWRLNK